jgi:CcmD family protein
MRPSIHALVLGVLLFSPLTLPGAPPALFGSVEAAAQQTPAARDEFVPVSELPPDEQLAAGPLLVAAYAIIWIVLMWYLWSIWRRLGRVEQELADALRRQGTQSRR